MQLSPLRMRWNIIIDFYASSGKPPQRGGWTIRGLTAPADALPDPRAWQACKRPNIGPAGYSSIHSSSNHQVMAEARTGLPSQVCSIWWRR